MKKICFFIFVWCCFFPVFAWSETPQPPTEIAHWFDYALKKYPPTDCPHLDSETVRCASLTQVSLSGDATTGQIQMEVTGYNWGRDEQTLDLLGPATSFSLENPSVNFLSFSNSADDEGMFMAPFFDKAGSLWKIKTPPGRFTLKAVVVFDATQPNIPLTLTEGVGQFSFDRLQGAFVKFDDQSGPHGGQCQLVLGAATKEGTEKPQIRVVRVFFGGSIPTFLYSVTVSGLKEETLVSIPLINAEIIESLAPDHSYTLRDEKKQKYLETTFSPGETQLSIKGHFEKSPEKLTLGDDLPFEVWLYVSDARYPAHIKTSARPVDPQEFSNIVDTLNARAFMLKPTQALNFEPILLSVDEGRKGTGRITYDFLEGYKGLWLNKLFLTATVRGQDRLTIPTPQPPIYAGLDSESLELFEDANNQLSVRLPAGGLDENNPVEVHWNIQKRLSKIGGIWKTALPAQKIHLQEQQINIHFLPGLVPVIAWASEGDTEGDLLDQFHLYGLLIALLAFFVTRGLKFNLSLSVLTSLLFLGLYLEPTFPTTFFLVLLMGTLPWTQIPLEHLKKIHQRIWLKRLLTVIWICLFTLSTMSLVQYSRSRIYSAFYPDAPTQSGGLYLNKKVKAMGPPQEAYKVDIDGYVQTEMNTTAGMVQDQAPSPLQKYSRKDENVNEWKAKPVKIQAQKPRGHVVTSLRQDLAPEQTTNLKIFMVGPWGRALWMMCEVAVILWALLATLGRGYRFLLGHL